MMTRDGPAGGQTGEAQADIEQPAFATPRSRRRQERQTWHQWVTQIGLAWRKNVEAIIAVGKLLQEAKDDLRHGDWIKMLRSGRLPFKEDTAQKLMAVARDEVLAKTANSRFLPANLETLHKLTKVDARLGEGTLLAKLKDHTINPRSKIKDVSALIGTRPRASRSRGDHSPKRFAFVNFLRGLTFVEQIDELRALQVALLHLGLRISIDTESEMPPPETIN